MNNALSRHKTIGVFCVLVKALSYDLTRFNLTL